MENEKDRSRDRQFRNMIQMVIKINMVLAWSPLILLHVRVLVTQQSFLNINDVLLILTSVIYIIGSPYT